MKPVQFRRISFAMYGLNFALLRVEGPMMLQMCPSIPVETPKGKGQATIIIDYSPEHDLNWVVFSDESRERCTYFQ